MQKGPVEGTPAKGCPLVWPARSPCAPHALPPVAHELCPRRRIDGKGECAEDGRCAAASSWTCALCAFATVCPSGKSQWHRSPSPPALRAGRADAIRAGARAMTRREIDPKPHPSGGGPPDQGCNPGGETVSSGDLGPHGFPHVRRVKVRLRTGGSPAPQTWNASASIKASISARMAGARRSWSWPSRMS